MKTARLVALAFGLGFVGVALGVSMTHFLWVAFLHGGI